MPLLLLDCQIQQRNGHNHSDSQLEVSLRAPDAFPGATLAPALHKVLADVCQGVQVSNLHSRREIAHLHRTCGASQVQVSSRKTLLAMTYLATYHFRLGY